MEKGSGAIVFPLVLADDALWITPGEGIPTEGTRHGKAEVTAFFQAVADTWNFTAFEPREFVASGDTVVALGSYAATARATGKTISSEWTMVWKFRSSTLIAAQNPIISHQAGALGLPASVRDLISAGGPLL